MSLSSSSLNEARDRNVFLRELYFMVNIWFPKKAALSICQEGPLRPIKRTEVLKTMSIYLQVKVWEYGRPGGY